MRFNTDLAKENGLPEDTFPKTAEEVAKIEEILALELDKLSLEEHEKITFDVHGFGNVRSALALFDNDNDEGTAKSPNPDMQHLLDEMDVEARALCVDASTCTSAYEHALYLNPEYVQSDYRLFFLRDNNFNPKEAAEHYVRHFETKKQYFESEKVLGRHVVWSDLSETEQKMVQTGFMQALPSLDVAGRRVIFFAPAFKPKDGTFDQMIRVCWYMCSTMSRNKDSLENGTILVVYNVGKYGDLLLGDFRVLKQRNTLRESLPLNLACDHFCYDDDTVHPFVTGQKLFTVDDDRCRMRAHFGSAAEVTFAMQTYGIQTDEFPINADGTLELKFHNEWLEMRQKLEAQDQTFASCVDEKDVIHPRRFDVLFGRGRDTRVHTGNLRATLLVEMYQDKYEAANKHEKTEIAERIIQIIHESHGRFLKLEGGRWITVDHDVAREKVSHLFRRLRNKATPKDEATRQSKRKSTKKDPSSASKNSKCQTPQE